MNQIQYWLLKSEPGNFSIDDLAACPDQRTHWDGVRNYQARNYLRDQMRPGDLVFFYHSNCKEPAIVGIIEVCSAGYPDHTAFDPESPYYDPKSKVGNPRWFMVDVRLVEKFDRPITLKLLKQFREHLQELPLLKRGQRLSVMPVAPEHWDFILNLAEKP